MTHNCTRYERTDYWVIRWSLSSCRPKAGPGGG
jgi:hypothetical protein